MKAYFLFAANGPLVILTTYEFIANPELLNKLSSRGISKFIAYEIPLETAKSKYGVHFNVVSQDLEETGDLRVLDYSGERVYRNFSFKELGPPIYCEPEEAAVGFHPCPLTLHKRMLVPLDGSKAAEIVLPYAGEIAGRLGNELILVSVSESGESENDPLYRNYLERLTGQVKEELGEWGVPGVLKLHSKILLGEAAAEILRYADESNVGLIAMASRGASGGGLWLLGNIAAKVLRAASQPVLLIRSPAGQAALQRKKLITKILVPLDGSKLGEAAMTCAETLANATGATLSLFQVIEADIPPTLPGGEGSRVYDIPKYKQGRKAASLLYLESVANPLRGKGLPVSIAVSFGSPADKIFDYASSNDIDLIAISTHGRSGIGRWVFGSVTDKVLHAGNTAVLVVRAASTA